MMNVNLKSTGFLGNPMLKSTQDRLKRMAQRDQKIAFFEQQKENLKSMKTDSLEDISRKLDMLQGYNDEIAMAKTEFNNGQIYHMLDEARELGEKMAKAAEKNAAKTPEERREELIEEITGVENDGLLGELMDELPEMEEELAEESMEKLEEVSEENLQELEENRALYQEDTKMDEVITAESIPDKYTRIDYRI